MPGARDRRPLRAGVLQVRCSRKQVSTGSSRNRDSGANLLALGVVAEEGVVPSAGVDRVSGPRRVIALA